MDKNWSIMTIIFFSILEVLVIEDDQPVGLPTFQGSGVRFCYKSSLSRGVKFCQEGVPRCCT